MIYSPLESVVYRLKEAVERVIRERYGLEESVRIEEEKKYGDFSFKCFSLAKAIGERPDKMAEAVKLGLEREHLPFVESIDAVGGYVNFKLNIPELAKMTFEAISKLRDKYGFNPAPSVERIIVEHTSANPIHPLHVGHLRNCCLGDSLARLLELRGHDVSRHFYVDDVGLQVAYAAYGYSKLGMPEPSMKPDHFIGYVYACTYNIVETISIRRRLEELKREQEFEEYKSLVSRLDEVLGVLSRLKKKSPETFDKLLDRISSEVDPEKEIAKINRLYEKKDPSVVDIVRKTVLTCLKGIKETLERLGVFFDSWDWESEVVWSSLVQEVIGRLRTTEFVAYKQGALILKAEEAARALNLKELLSIPIKYEIPDMVLIRSDGSTLYTTRDIAYTILKFKNAEKVVNVIGVEQKLAQIHLKIALSILGFMKEVKNLVHYAYEQVKLSRVRMSSRRGVIVTIDDLIEEAKSRALLEIEQRARVLSYDEKLSIAEAIGIGALKYSMLSVSPTKPIVFDWKRVLDFTQNSGPFLQYAYVRAYNILAKSSEGESILGCKVDTRLFASKEERDLLKHLSKFPAVVAKAADDLRPDYITEYVNDLAKMFNLFYDNYPVLSAEETLRKARLKLVASTALVLRNVLTILGIKPITRM